MPVLSEIEDLFSIYFEDDTNQRKVLESKRIEKLEIFAPWGLKYNAHERGSNKFDSKVK